MSGMDRPRLIRGLRIAVSAALVILCILLFALWMRSYWWVTNIQTHPVASRSFQCAFFEGRIYLRSYHLVTQADRDEWISDFSHYHWKDSRFHDNNVGDLPTPAFKFSVNEFRPGDIIVIFPYWFAFLVFATLAAAPWIRWSKQFSLRTLLLATTLIAILLGAIVIFG
jgi:hypothetical protein